jgi:hypothetical protein
MVLLLLSPKGEEAVVIQKFRPICLMNTSLKMVTKGMNNRLAPVAEKIIDKSQTDFMQNRYIMEGFSMLHEILHEVKKKKMSGVLFKVDFKKAYDNVNWSFLYNILVRKGFSAKWNDLVFSVMTSGRVNIKMNDEIGGFFPTYRGVRQGDPLSAILFNVVGDAMSVMVKNAQQSGVLKGIVPHIQENGIAILQYADDTMFLLEEGFENARNLKFLLCLFEQMSGLKINFLKSEVFCLGVPKIIF